MHLTRLLALVTTAFALIALATLIATGGAPSSAAHALPPGAGIPGGAPVPVALTISYAIIGGGGSQAQDLLTYTSNGNQQVVPLSTSPAVYLVDSGTQWSVQTVLNGSVDNERWITPLAVAGTITMPLTISFLAA